MGRGCITLGHFPCQHQNTCGPQRSPAEWEPSPRNAFRNLFARVFFFKPLFFTGTFFRMLGNFKKYQSTCFPQGSPDESEAAPRFGPKTYITAFQRVSLSLQDFLSANARRRRCQRAILLHVKLCYEVLCDSFWVRLRNHRPGSFPRDQNSHQRSNKQFTAPPEWCVRTVKQLLNELKNL